MSADDRLPTRLGPGDWVWDDAEQSWRESKDYEVGPPPDWKAYVDRAIAEALAAPPGGTP